MGGEGTYTLNIVGSDGEQIAYGSTTLILECEPMCHSNFILGISGANPSCPFCETMFLEVRAWADTGGEACIGGIVSIALSAPTLEACSSESGWWTVNDNSFTVVIAEDFGSATPFLLEFYPNGCPNDGCNINNRSWIGPDPGCSGQTTSCYYEATDPDGEITTGCFEVSNQGSC